MVTVTSSARCSPDFNRLSVEPCTPVDATEGVCGAPVAVFVAEAPGHSGPFLFRLAPRLHKQERRPGLGTGGGV